MAKYLDIPGEPIAPGTMVSLKARELASALKDSSIEFARLVGRRTARDRTSSSSTPRSKFLSGSPTQSSPSSGSRSCSIATTPTCPRCSPSARTSRRHRTSTCGISSPRSLCLYDGASATSSVVGLRLASSSRSEIGWRLTAKGKLHQDDQPLKPLMFGHVGTLVLPSDLLDPGQGKQSNRLTITSTDSERGKLFLADRSERRPEKKGFRVVASVHRCEPKSTASSAIGRVTSRTSPASSRRRGEWKDEASKDPTILDYHVAVVIVMPKTRWGGPDAEWRDVWAFLSTDTIRDAGQKLGLWQLEGGVIGYILGGDAEKTGEDIKLDLLNPSLRLTRPSTQPRTGIGRKSRRLPPSVSGPLDTQVAMNLAQGRVRHMDGDRRRPDASA